MPELPEVETIFSEIHQKFLKKKIKKVVLHTSKLRWIIPKNLPALLKDQSFQNIARRGKYLLFYTQNGSMIIHLGMAGSLRISEHNKKPIPYERVTILFDDNTTLSLVDPRKFSACLWTNEDPLLHPLLKTLGVEPLTKDFNADYLFEKIKNRKIPIKQLIMDSKIVTGVGNIYASESLFVAKLPPLKPANTLTISQITNLVAAIKKVLKLAIKNGGTSIRDYTKSDGSNGNFQNKLYVYGKENKPCKTCGTLIKRSRHGQRSTFYCPKCQFDQNM